MDINALLANAPKTVEKDPNEPKFDWDNATYSDNYQQLKQQLTKATKIPTNIRLSKEVSDYFKSTGKGWQTRINAVLQDYVAKQTTH